MSRDDELRMSRCREVVNDLEERELSLRRQRRLRLIQDVDSLLEAIGEQRNEGFSVGLLVQRFPAVGAHVRYLLDVCREVVETLRAHEEPFGDFWQPRQPEGLG